MRPSITSPLILASTSPYRRRLLERLGLTFTCVPPRTDESPGLDEHPDALARRLSDAKARAVSVIHPDAIVIGSDQVAALPDDGRGNKDNYSLLGKPGTPAVAREQLQRCAGKSVEFYTGVSLAHNDLVLEQRCVITRVTFRNVSCAQISAYVERDQPLDCAGSFRWEGLGISLFTAISSADPTALEGLPLISTCSMLENIGIYPL